MKGYNADVKIISDGKRRTIQIGEVKTISDGEVTTLKVREIKSIRARPISKTNISKRLLNTAYHEAGHVVAFFEFDLNPFDFVTIIPDPVEDSSGRVQQTGKAAGFKKRLHGILTAKDERVIKYTLICDLAGAAASGKFRNVKRITLGMKGDINSFVELSEKLLKDEELIPIYYNYILAEAKALVEREPVWNAIRAIAEELLIKKTLTYKECHKIYLASNRLPN